MPLSSSLNHPENTPVIRELNDTRQIHELESWQLGPYILLWIFGNESIL
jgi:hypothetical protein